MSSAPVTLAVVSRMMASTKSATETSGTVWVASATVSSVLTWAQSWALSWALPSVLAWRSDLLVEGGVGDVGDGVVGDGVGNTGAG